MTTSWIRAHPHLGRLVALALLAVALAGPWTYTGDGVPPPEWCEPPHILLENGRCADLVSGTNVIGFTGSVFFTLGAGLVSGTLLPGQGREFLISLGLFVAAFLLLLPFITTVRLLLGGRRRSALAAVIWGLAAATSLALAVLQAAPQPIRLWGIWLYTALAAGGLAWELLASRRPTTDAKPAT